MRRLLVSVPAIVLLVLAVFALTPCMATCGSADDVVTAAVLACPQARALLDVP